jgi:hypothetical protein
MSSDGLKRRRSRILQGLAGGFGDQVKAIEARNGVAEKGAASIAG